ncbi:hypothetical protein BB560_006436 [Smittium megazygosporum]|uniref:Ysc84 actin-binding domain-containing protein n=1 Tax=Smittium megazygosporum TaxID=133381 RepID=A0A2T9Y613_9FUNG|nr:hypothetical protein BB560_006436 [Smittium megazygosporum]
MAIVSNDKYIEPTPVVKSPSKLKTVGSKLHISTFTGVVPPSVIQNCRGVVILRFSRVGFMVTGKYGTGVVISKLPDGTWSAPAYIRVMGAGYGYQAGGQFCEMVLVLNSNSALRSFSHSGTVSFGVNAGVTVGGKGLNAEFSSTVPSFVPIYCYTNTTGLYCGAAFEGCVVAERKKKNARHYGQGVRSIEILQGRVRPTPEADKYYDKIQAMVSGPYIPSDDKIFAAPRQSASLDIRSNNHLEQIFLGDRQKTLVNRPPREARNSFGNDQTYYERSYQEEQRSYQGDERSHLNKPVDQDDPEDQGSLYYPEGPQTTSK